MINKRLFIKNALALIPAGISIRLLAAPSDTSNKIFALLQAQVEHLKRLASLDGMPGLYQAGKAPGVTTGEAIGEGYLGQTITDHINASTNTHEVYINRVFPKGLWLVTVSVSTHFGENTVTVQNYFSLSLRFNAHGVLKDEIPFFATTATLANPFLVGTTSENQGTVPIVADGTKALQIYVFSSQASYAVSGVVVAVRIA